MKKALLLPFFVPLLLCSCSARQAGKPAAQDNGKSLLWRIEKDGSKPSWLFGTIHMICKDDYIWTDAMEQGLRQSAVVCFEMDMDDPATMMRAAAGLMDTSGRTLHDYFTPEQYARLEKYIRDSLGGNLAIFSRMKPFALQALFTTKLGDCDAPVSYESMIMAAAQKEQKEIAGLETVERQLALVSSIPADTIVSAVMEMVDHPGGDMEEYREMLAAYRDQDLPRLHRIVMETTSLTELKGPFLDERNREWIARMKEMMRRQTVFFAVGAGHLWGEQGVISLLRKQGYTVSPVHD